MPLTMINHERLAELNPPVLGYRDGRWGVFFNGSIHRRFVVYARNADAKKLELVLQDDFRAWLGRNDPNYSCSRSLGGMNLYFSSEDAAMLFRMTYKVRMLEP